MATMIINILRYPETRLEHAFNDAVAYYYPDFRRDGSFDYIREARDRIQCTDEEFQQMQDQGFIEVV